jgi:hypothetical protein
VREDWIEHAVRILRYAPAHSMAADRLRERIRQETGVDVGTTMLLQSLRARSDRFMVLLPAFEVGEQPAWRAGERALYERALAAAGLTAPTVMLAPEPVARDDLRPPPAPGEALADVQAAVAELLEANGGDAEFTEALSLAVVQLDAARQQLVLDSPGSRSPAAARDSADCDDTAAVSAAAARSTTVLRRPRPQ